MTRLRLPVLLLAGLALTGCGSEPVPDQLAAPGVLPATPSASAAPPSPDVEAPAATAATEEVATAVPSVEPPPAIEGDPTAAEVAEVEQFIRDYYAAINSAQYAGDVAALEALSIPQCNCRGTVDAIKQMLALGTVQAAKWDLRSIDVRTLAGDTASAVAVVQVADGHVLDAAGAVVANINNLDDEYYTHTLIRTEGGWTTAQILS